MIVFLMIVYCAVLVVLLKLKLLRPTLAVKLSPLGFMLLLLIALFIPMMFWAPSGNVIVTKAITRITPRVGGRIIKVHVEANQQVKKGDPLLTVDPAPYQDSVNALKAQLAAAKQNVLELKATLDAATSAVTQAKSQREAAKSQLDAAANTVTQAKASSALAQTKLKILDDTRALDPGAVSKLQYEQAVQAVAEANAAVKVAQSNEQTAKTNYGSVTVAAIETAQANELKARLAYTSEINGVNTKVAQVSAELSKAEWDLSETTIYAPSNGYVTSFVLTEGSAIAIAAGSAMINFLADDEPTYIIAAIQEKNLRYVEPGQKAEVALPLYPGETLIGKVDEVVWVTGEGQIMPQAAIPVVAQRVKTGGEFAVKITLDPEWSAYRLPIGAGGVAAIYTAHGKPSHVIRQVVIRQATWMNYIFQMPGQ